MAYSRYSTMPRTEWNKLVRGKITRKTAWNLRDWPSWRAPLSDVDLIDFVLKLINRATSGPQVYHKHERKGEIEATKIIAHTIYIGTWYLCRLAEASTRQPDRYLYFCFSIYCWGLVHTWVRTIFRALPCEPMKKGQHQHVWRLRNHAHGR